MGGQGGRWAAWLSRLEGRCLALYARQCKRRRGNGLVGGQGGTVWWVVKANSRGNGPVCGQGGTVWWAVKEGRSRGRSRGDGLVGSQRETVQLVVKGGGQMGDQGGTVWWAAWLTRLEGPWHYLALYAWQCKRQRKPPGACGDTCGAGCLPWWPVGRVGARKQ